MINYSSLCFYITTENIFYSQLTFWINQPSVVDSKYSLLYKNLRVVMLRNIGNYRHKK